MKTKGEEMKIEVISVDEETGKTELNLDEEATVWLLQLGFNKLLRDSIDSANEDRDIDGLVQWFYDEEIGDNKDEDPEV